LAEKEEEEQELEHRKNVTRMMRKEMEREKHEPGDKN
jgi:hypothetical protein